MKPARFSVNRPRNAEERRVFQLQRKPRPEATLKNLPERKQTEIMELLRCTPMRAAVVILGEQGIRTSRQALGRFYRWRQEQQREIELFTIAAKSVEKVRRENPEITEAQIAERVRQIFMIHAISAVGDRPTDAANLWHKLTRRLFLETLKPNAIRRAS